MVSLKLRLIVLQVIEANLSGEMNLKIETDLVSVTAHFKDLGNPAWGKLPCVASCVYLISSILKCDADNSTYLLLVLTK